MVEAKGEPANEVHAINAAHAIDLTRAGDPAIRTDAIGKAASVVSAHPRRAGRRCFSSSATSRPGLWARAEGRWIDGRDIGTVICPEATAKLFIDARPEVRANRRWKELQGLGIARDEAHIRDELIARDAADRDRPISPMKPAADALLLDTSDLDIDARVRGSLGLGGTQSRGRAQSAAKGLRRPGGTSSRFERNRKPIRPCGSARENRRS
ncbi:MAG: (d)CMP kinase [Rhizomicrobium sp.]